MKIVDLLVIKSTEAGNVKNSKEILTFSRNAPNKYKVYSIPKRTAGLRTIAHPSKELKFYQRILSDYFQKELPIHNAAFAYRKGISIKDNADKHRCNKYLLKMDFENFFNSITPHLFHKRLIESNVQFSSEDFILIQQLCFWCPTKKHNGKLILSVGAPVSPVISNFIMYEFDKVVSKWCVSNNITYTRYADDITFSTKIKDILFDVPAFITSILKDKFLSSIQIKATKTIFSSKAHNRHITGITITNDGKLSIGRERKRYISSLIYQFKNNELSTEDILHLKGLLSFASHIEPVLIQRMIKKYSKETLVQIKQFCKVN
jgi:retron-type reverse transcriptase